MDTITGLDMAREMMNWGGAGIVHRFMSIEKQAEIMNKLCYMPGSKHVLLKMIYQDVQPLELRMII